jgi:hypothetical protein
MSSDPLRPAATPEISLARLSSRMAAAAAVLLAGLAVAGVIAIGLPSTPLDLYDVSFSLLWGRELLAGAMPDVHVWGASTPHPASILAGALASAFGAHALEAMRALLYLAAGLLVVGFVAIGRALRLPALGVVAALTLAVSAPLVANIIGTATVSDLPSAACVLGAIALESARRRRGTGPLALLALAGLFRPEAWVLSAAYWCYLAAGATPRQRLRHGLLAALGPCLWVGADLLMTGDPLYSLTYTQTATIASARPTGLAQAPQALIGTLRDNFSAPVLAGAVAGLACNLRTRALPAVVAPAMALSAASFLALGAASLPLDQRYALPLLCLTALCFAYFLVGWWPLRTRRTGWAWGAAALLVLALTAVEVPRNLRALDVDRGTLSREAATETELAALVRPPAVRTALERCGPLAANWRIVPILAYDLRRRPGTLTVVDSGVPARGVVVEATRGVAGVFFQDITHPLRSFERRHYSVLAQNADFTMYARC